MSASSVSKATLTVYVDHVSKSGTFDVYEVNNSWAEGSLTYNTAARFGQQDRQCDQRSMAPMAMARVGLAAATVNGKIYAIGGQQQRFEQ